MGGGATAGVISAHVFLVQQNWTSSAVPKLLPLLEQAGLWVLTGERALEVCPKYGNMCFLSSAAQEYGEQQYQKVPNTSLGKNSTFQFFLNLLSVMFPHGCTELLLQLSFCEYWQVSLSEPCISLGLP